MIRLTIGPVAVDLGGLQVGPLALAEWADVAASEHVRGGMAALGMCAPSLPYLALLRAANYQPLVAGEAIADMLMRQGATLADLQGACAPAAAHLVACVTPTPVAPPKAADPYPGLRIDGMSYPEWGRQAVGVTAIAEGEVWAAAHRARDAGTLAEWVAAMHAAGKVVTWAPPSPS